MGCLGGGCPLWEYGYREPVSASTVHIQLLIKTLSHYVGTGQRAQPGLGPPWPWAHIRILSVYIYTMYIFVYCICRHFYVIIYNDSDFCNPLL